MKSKKVGVLFSGGLDSTYLVWKNLKEGNYVYPYYVKIDNNDTKSTLEQNRINLLISLFKEEFPNQISYNQTIMNIGINTYGNDKLMYTQMPIWLLSTLFLQTSEMDEIQIGYVCGDDMISYINEIKKIYYSYKPIIYGKMTKLTFPIIKDHKRQIVDELPSKYFDLTITCENAVIIENSKNEKNIKYEPCGCCDPCKKINNYLINNYSDIHKKAYSNMLVKEISRNRNYLNEDNKKMLEYTLKPLPLYMEVSKNNDGRQLTFDFYENLIPSEEKKFSDFINDFDKKVANFEYEIELDVENEQVCKA